MPASRPTTAPGQTSAQRPDPASKLRTAAILDFVFGALLVLGALLALFQLLAAPQPAQPPWAQAQTPNWGRERLNLAFGALAAGQLAVGAGVVVSGFLFLKAQPTRVRIARVINSAALLLILLLAVSRFIDLGGHQDQRPDLLGILIYLLSVLCFANVVWIAHQFEVSRCTPDDSAKRAAANEINRPMAAPAQATRPAAESAATPKKKMKKKKQPAPGD